MEISVAEKLMGINKHQILIKIIKAFVIFVIFVILQYL